MQEKVKKEERKMSRGKKGEGRKEERQMSRGRRKERRSTSWHLNIDAQRLSDDEDVREEDRGVEVVPADWLSG